MEFGAERSHREETTAAISLGSSVERGGTITEASGALLRQFRTHTASANAGWITLVVPK